MMPAVDRVFVYGSLVNPSARPPGRVIPATLTGWFRDWDHCIVTADGNMCALTVRPADRMEIDGLLFTADDPKQLDAREVGYSRQRTVVRTSPGTRVEEQVDCFLYVGEPAYRRSAGRAFPVVRSYLDCVVAGYLRLGGLAAARDFMATTRGWDAEILDDRDHPIYPRAVTLTAAEARDIDELLRSVR